MSFRTKVLLHTNITIFFFMIGLASLLLHLRTREVEETIERDAKTFATLTVGPICEAYDNYYKSGYVKFRELIISLLSLNKKLDNISIYSVEGKELFNSDELKRRKTTTLNGVQKESNIERIKKISSTFTQTADGKYYDLIFPYIEPWGWHRYSVRFLVSKECLAHDILVLRLVVFSLTFLAVVLASLSSHFIVRAMTFPLEHLTATAKTIAEGNLDVTFDVKSHDEIGTLAKTLQGMVTRIKRDMISLKKQKDILTQKNKELERLSNLKTQFLANITHELVTPLTSVKGYIEYIYQGKMGPLSPTQKKGLEVARKNINRLHRQITDLLDFASLESGKVKISLSPFHIKKLIKDVITSLSTSFRDKNISYEEKIPDSIPPVIADKEKITQVFENLLTNAVKYTPSGGKITISCYNLDGAPKGKVKICVADTGIGIPEEVQKNIFDDFYHFDPRHKYKGIGLGLSIVKSILDAHKEEIEIKSERNKGSIFCFTLPVYIGGSKG